MKRFLLFVGLFICLNYTAIGSMAPVQRSAQSSLQRGLYRTMQGKFPHKPITPATFIGTCAPTPLICPQSRMANPPRSFFSTQKAESIAKHQPMLEAQKTLKEIFSKNLDQEKNEKDALIQQILSNRKLTLAILQGPIALFGEKRSSTVPGQIRQDWHTDTWFFRTAIGSTRSNDLDMIDALTNAFINNLGQYIERTNMVQIWEGGDDRLLHASLHELIRRIDSMSPELGVYRHQYAKKLLNALIEQMAKEETAAPIKSEVTTEATLEEAPKQSWFQNIYTSFFSRGKMSRSSFEHEQQTLIRTLANKQLITLQLLKVMTEYDITNQLIRDSISGHTPIEPLHTFLFTVTKEIFTAPKEPTPTISGEDYLTRLAEIETYVMRNVKNKFEKNPDISSIQNVREKLALQLATSPKFLGKYQQQFYNLIGNDPHLMAFLQQRGISIQPEPDLD
ncbi:MAG: hypothetical protein WCE21_05280 [Candidatus Babeliales bacterium]